VHLGRNFAIPRLHSGEIVTTRTKEILRSMWHKHMRWLGRTKEQKRKKVEPDGPSEATHGHELYPHESASIVP